MRVIRMAISRRMQIHAMLLLLSLPLLWRWQCAMHTHTHTLHHTFETKCLPIVEFESWIAWRCACCKIWCKFEIALISSAKYDEYDLCMHENRNVHVRNFVACELCMVTLVVWRADEWGSFVLIFATTFAELANGEWRMDEW